MKKLCKLGKDRPKTPETRVSREQPLYVWYNLLKYPLRAFWDIHSQCLLRFVERKLSWERDTQPSWRTRNQVHFRSFLSTSSSIFSDIFLQKASLNVPKFAEIGTKPRKWAPYGKGIVCSDGIFATWGSWNQVNDKIFHFPQKINIYLNFPNFSLKTTFCFIWS